MKGRTVHGAGAVAVGVPSTHSVGRDHHPRMHEETETGGWSDTCAGACGWHAEWSAGGMRSRKALCVFTRKM